MAMGFSFFFWQLYTWIKKIDLETRGILGAKNQFAPLDKQPNHSNKLDLKP